MRPKTMKSQPVGSADLEDKSFDEEMLSAVGKIMLACAKIDDLLANAIFKYLNMSQRNGYLLLGQMPISERIKRMRIVVLSTAPEGHVSTYDSLCGDMIKAVTDYRNTLAHGVYLGYKEATETYLFRMPANVMDADNEFVATPIREFTRTGLLNIGNDYSPKVVEAVKSFFGLPEPRELHQGLYPAPGPPPQTPPGENMTEEPPTPPPSSQA